MNSFLLCLTADENGFPSQKLLDMMIKLSKGGCGLIVPGYVYPIQHGKANVGQTGMTTKDHAEAWREAIKEIHKNGSKIMFQIAHAGDRGLETESHHQPIGCSGLLPGSRAMTEAEICETIDAFIKASKNLKEVGADGVQLHAAHGYLLSQFLSPYLNRRTDQWGGLTENRTRIVFEIINQIRKATHDSIAVGIKLNGNDFVDGGIDPPMCCEIVSMLPPLDLVEVSCSIMNKAYHIRADVREEVYKKNCKNYKEVIQRAHELLDGIPYMEGYNSDASALLKETFPELPVACVGGWRTVEKMEFALNTSKADIISMSRPFLKQPNLVNAIRNGAEKVDCDSCSLCSLNRAPGIKCQNWVK